jgi:hypothetical protein
MSLVDALGQLANNWPTVALSVFLGLSGGVVGATIAARTQRRLAGDSLREEARRALRTYERSLIDLGMQFELQIIDDGSRSLSGTTWDSLATARESAFPFADRLPEVSRDLVRMGWVEETWPGEDPLTTSNALWARGKKLGEAIDAAFPVRP